MTASKLTAYQSKSGSINASDEARGYLEGSVQYEQQISATRLQIADHDELPRLRVGAGRRHVRSLENFQQLRVFDRTVEKSAHRRC